MSVYSGTTSYQKPKTIIKEYLYGWAGQGQRKRAEKKIFADGYEIESEEEVKKWEAGNACCLAIIFLPLIFIKTKKVRVTYKLK